MHLSTLDFMLLGSLQSVNALGVGVAGQALDVLTCERFEKRGDPGRVHALRAEVDALKRLQAETAAALDALLPSILDRAFKGEL